MPTYYARKTGNINATDVWATTPTGTASDLFSSFNNADTLMANGFTVTLNVNATVLEIRNDATGGATASGSFTLSNGVTLTANVIAGTAQCVSFTGGAGSTVVGSITAGTASSAHGINHNGSGLLTITGNVTGGSGGNAYGVLLNSTGSISVTGNVTGGAGSASAGIASANTGTVSVTGSVTGGIGGSGVLNAASGQVVIVGACVGAQTSGLNNSASGTVSATRARGGPLSASSVGIASSSTGTSSVSEIEYGDAGASPTSGPIRLTDATTNVSVMYRFGTTKKNLVDANASGLMPAASNVRSGTVYNGGNSTGTCAVPGAASVLVGVAVDNTVGTAAVSSAAIQSACDAALTAFSSGRLGNVATVASTGQQLANALTP